MHGYGANEADLFDLARDIPAEFLVLSVRAPRTLTEGSYSWFAIDFSSGSPVNDKAQAEESRLLLKKFIDEAVVAWNADRANIVLVGFSQGAIMSASVALTFPHSLRAIAMLSGRILEEIRPHVKESDRLKKLDVFIGHGTEDTVLRVDFAREANAYLATLGITSEYHEYPTSHGIIKEEKDSLLVWLGKISRR